MDRVYSDGFILDCANPLKESDNETFQLIRDRLKKSKLQIGIFESDYWIDKIRELRKGSEIDRFVYKQVMDWFQAGPLQKVYFNSNDLPENDNDRVSSIWLETEEKEQQIFDFLEKKNLLSLIKEEILNDHYRWLFRVTELPTIAYNSHFNWSEYLELYAHYTDKVYIWDRYFLYNWKTSLSDLIGPFLDLNPNLKVEIISELNDKNDSYDYGLKNLARLKNEFGKRISFYKPTYGVGKRHHDRYLMTSYCLLKSEPGFNIQKGRKSFRETTPTLIGRYAEGNHKWKTEMQQWDHRKNKSCTPISL